MMMMRIDVITYEYDARKHRSKERSVPASCIKSQGIDFSREGGEDEPYARLMFFEKSLPRTCLVVSLRRDLLSPKFSDTIRLRSLVKGKEGVASVYVISDSVVLRTL